MNAKDLQHALDEAEQIGSDAAEIVLRGYRAHPAIHKKGETDLVTEYDLRSEELIRRRIGAAFPGHAIIGEEQPPSGSGELVWYVDPLDGTTNFAHGHPVFAVSIGLCRGAEPLVGVVIAPALGISWTAARGLGARRNGALCHVSSSEPLDAALCATGFPYDGKSTPDNNVAEHAAFLRTSRGVRRCGAAAIDLAWVADGTFDLYWEQRLKAWDMAAGACLVLEAGGKLSAYDGGPADLRTGWLVASNGRVHREALAVLSQTRRGVS